jgi:SAM-dependent methyltransferase
VLDEFECPACGQTCWTTGATHRYQPSELRAGTEGQRQRRRVLFDVWCRGASEVALTEVRCDACGCWAYSPRPTAAEIDAKYDHLMDVGERRHARRPDGRNERRALATARLARRYASAPHGFDVLDVGGADGTLLQPLRRRAGRCALVDYKEATLPGVERLGATLDEVPDDQTFDVILLCHVLEHMADPRRAVEAARDHLAPGGVLVVEVPLEVWGGLPIEVDPVTHVNFFTSSALAALLRRAGMEVVELHEAGTVYDGGHKEVIRAVARTASAVPRTISDPRLAPRWAVRARRRWRLRQVPGGRALRALDRRAWTLVSKAHDALERRGPTRAPETRPTTTAPVRSPPGT